ncbi:MAG: ABC transporter permease subunit [Gammaproteobacteria bacterium]|nr:ABC transporter permease subunit [Gammaproteobacteria bacterium]
MSTSPAAIGARVHPLRPPAGATAWMIVGLIVLITLALRDDYRWLVDYPRDWIVPVADWVNVFMTWFIDVFRWLFRAISWLISWPMEGIRVTLQWLPWSATISVIVTLAYVGGGWRLASFSALALLYMVVVGYWPESVATLSLVAMSVPLSACLGLFIGIAAYTWRSVDRIVQPTLDLMQTFPTFAYLIPILFLFGFGPVVGLIASAIYAVPPMVRNVILGLRRVAPEIIESGKMSGASRRQLLWSVRIPSAMPTIMIGVNQAIMAALSMVIIASVIGSSADIGWEVLSMMRKALFGQSFLAGIVIALLAMVMDRISREFAHRGPVEHDAHASWLTRHRFLVIALGSALGFVVLARFVPVLGAYPDEWRFYPADQLNQVVNFITREYGAALDALKNNTLFYFLLPVRVGLENTVKPFTWGFELTPAFIAFYSAGVALLAVLAGWRWSWRASVIVIALGLVYYYGTIGIPWAAFIAVTAVLAYQVGGWRTGLLAVLGLGFIVTTGAWAPAMRSVYLCGAAVFISFVAGGALGVCAARSDRMSAILRPINDTLQTMPLFVFLIPVIMFFQVGDFPALLAIMMYAIVPAIRYTEHGIRSIPAHIVEAARAQGCTRRQILFDVQLPLALPEIMMGLNQTIMFGMAMLVVAALVGTRGLGQAVYLALNTGNVGEGFIAGLSMAFIAMIADRITQAWSARKKAELGL